MIKLLAYAVLAGFCVALIEVTTVLYLEIRKRRSEG